MNVRERSPRIGRSEARSSGECHFVNIDSQNVVVCINVHDQKKNIAQVPMRGDRGLPEFNALLTLLEVRVRCESCYAELENPCVSAGFFNFRHRQNERTFKFMY